MDSVKLMSLNDSIHRLHSGVPKSGHIYKGHSFVSPYATIPSKYETFVIENNERRGFNSTSQRFNYELNENLNPGIGHYSDTSDLHKTSPSISKKGTGNFASKTNYKSQPMNKDLPAPNIYNPVDCNKKDFNRSSATSNFHQNICHKSNQLQNSAMLPAPNAYNIEQKDQGSIQMTSTFKSRTKRDLKLVEDSLNKPGPCQYTINKADKLHKLNTSPLKSVFNSKTKRGFYMLNDAPSPTQYNVAGEIGHKERINEKMLKNKQYYYLCMAANALKLPPTSPTPGPGQYNVSQSIGQPAHFMSSSMFTSTASRWTNPASKSNITNIGIPLRTGQAPIDFPGPAQYQPMPIVPQSFHYNHDNKWVC